MQFCGSVTRFNLEYIPWMYKNRFSKGFAQWGSFAFHFGSWSFWAIVCHSHMTNVECDSGCYAIIAIHFIPDTFSHSGVCAFSCYKPYRFKHHLEGSCSQSVSTISVKHKDTSPNPKCCTVRVDSMYIMYNLETKYNKTACPAIVIRVHMTN